jgi:hypothetical protein
MIHPSYSGNVLVVGDIHHRTEEAEAAIRNQDGRYDKVVLLGDYFDRFRDDGDRMRQTCRWLKESLHDSRRIHLLGNHDLAYVLYGHDQSFCPGWTVEKQQVFKEELKDVRADSFRMAVQVGPWLLSHAGFSTDLAGGRNATGLVEIAEAQYADGIGGRRAPIFEVGRARGGTREKGGVLWLDWNAEFRPVKGVNQIVGHTPCRGVVRGKFIDASGNHRGLEVCKPSPWPRPPMFAQPGAGWASVNWCIDCGLVFTGLIRGSEFEVLDS